MLLLQVKIDPFKAAYILDPAGSLQPATSPRSSWVPHHEREFLKD